MELVVMVGVPGCGKSTWVKQHLASTHVVVSSDLWPNAPHKGTRRERALADALGAGLDVVVDDVNPTRRERAALIEVAHRYHARVRAVHIDAPPGSCPDRPPIGARRPSVTKHGVVATRHRVAAPAVEEGFDEVETVAPVAA